MSTEKYYCLSFLYFKAVGTFIISERFSLFSSDFGLQGTYPVKSFADAGGVLYMAFSKCFSELFVFLLFIHISLKFRLDYSISLC